MGRREVQSANRLELKSFWVEKAESEGEERERQRAAEKRAVSRELMND